MTKQFWICPFIWIHAKLTGLIQGWDSSSIQVGGNYWQTSQQTDSGENIGCLGEVINPKQFGFLSQIPLFLSCLLGFTSVESLKLGDSLQFRHTSIAKPLHSETPQLRNAAVPTLPPKHCCSEIKHRYPWCWNPHFQPHSHISEVG